MIAKHVIRIVVAYLFAEMTAAFLYGVYVLFYEYLEFFLDPHSNLSWLIETFRSNVWFSCVMLLLFAIPSIAVICVCEYFEMRQPLVYLVLACICGMSLGFGLAIRDHSITMSQFLFIPTSLLAGLIYWLIAGRHAGL